MAAERNERVGQSIGYRVRFEESVSRDTRILVVTEGVLLRRLQDDPFLEDISVVIFDEFHERRLDSDLALAMVRRVQQTVRADLKIVAMSATQVGNSGTGRVSPLVPSCSRSRAKYRTRIIQVAR